MRPLRSHVGRPVPTLVDRVVVAALACLLGLLVPLGTPAQAAAGDGGDLEGSVVDGQGRPLVGIEVVAAPRGAQGATDETTTENGGAWRLTLPAGRYSLTFAHPGGQFAEVVRDDVLVSVADQPTVVERVVMVPVTRGSLTGRVLDDEGQPVPSATLTLVQGIGSAGSFEETEEIDTADTDPQGRYAFTGVPLGAGQWFTVRGEAPEFRDTYLGGASSWTQATFREMVLPAAFPDLSLVRDPGITGVVSGPDGPVGGVTVELLGWQGGTTGADPWVFAGSDETDSAGRYRLPLSEGTFTLRFDPTWATAPLRAQFLGGDHPECVEDAERFTVDATVTPLVRDVLLRRAPTAGGRVVHNGVPRAGVQVTPYVWNDEADWWDQEASVSTGADGRFVTRVTPERFMTFRLTPGGDGGPDDGGPLLDGSSEPPEWPEGSNAVWTGADGLALGTLDLAAPAPGLRRVEGRVQAQGGAPVAGAVLTLSHRGGPWDGTVVATEPASGDDGSFGFLALPGDYAVRAEHPACVFDPGAPTLHTAVDDHTALVVGGTCLQSAAPPGPGGAPPALPPAGPSTAQTPPPATPPAPSAAASKAEATLKLRLPVAKVRAEARLTVVVKVRAAARGRAAGAVEFRIGRKVVGKVRVRSTRRGATVRLKLPARRLGVGTHRLRAVFGGNATTAPASSPKVRIRVRR